MKYSGVLVLFPGLGYFFANEFHLVNHYIQISTSVEAVTLELEDGTIEVFSSESSKEIQSTKGQVVAV